MSVSVEHAQFLINSPGTISEAVVGVTKADLQPSSSAIALTSIMALTAASFDANGQVVALQWEQDTLTISVDAAAITIAAQQIDGRRGIPVLVASPSFAGQNILFQLSSGDWTVPVDTGIPTILGQDVVLEKNQYFERGAPTLSGSSVVLSENAVVVSAAPTIAGQDITLTWGQGIAGVETASFDIDGQEIALNKTWSLAVDSTALDIDGQNVGFEWLVDATVVVESASFSAVGQNLVLTQGIPVTSTAISPVGQTLGRGDGTIVTPAFLEFTQSDVDFIFDYPFGVTFDPAGFSVLGKDVVLFLGSGAPTRVRSFFTKDRIQIAFSKPPTFRRHDSEKIRG